MRTATASAIVPVIRPRRISAVRKKPQPLVIREATAADAGAIHALIAEHLSEGHLLARRRDEIEINAHRFMVVVDGGRIVACADLAPLSRKVAEVRSLVVTQDARSRGLGLRLVSELSQRASVAGFEALCAFTHAAGYFVRMGFSIVPHTWLPEKIEADCRSCPQFRQCGQHAVLLPLAQARHSCVPLTHLHG